jgi:hypothetical protein
VSARSLFLIAALIAVASASVFEANVIARQNEELRTLEKTVTDSSGLVMTLRHEADANRRALATAEEQLAAKPAAVAITPADGPLETNAWLARVLQLKRLFNEQPERRIPEMQWLTDEDWLRVGKRASFDDDHHTRKALGDLRTQAKTKFFKLANPALRSFAQTAGGQVPSSALVLAPYFQPPIGAAILERYEFVKDEPGNIGDGVLTLREKTSVDADYDSRHYASSNGSNLSGGSMGPPNAWIPDFRERSMRAFKDYVKANNGAQPIGTAPLLPYFNPPLDPAKVALIIRFEHERAKP